jgi:tetratricopeptide (TPR) repeat protein
MVVTYTASGDSFRADKPQLWSPGQFTDGGLATFGYVPPKEAFPKARETALKALEIDDTLAEAHAQLGFVKTYYEWDWSGAEKEYRRAIELNSGDATTHALYSFTLTVLGRFVEAIAEQKQALELDPVSANTNWNVGYVFFVARQYDQAIEQLRKTQELDPDFLPAHVTLGWAYVEKSMYKDGIAELDKVLAMAPGNTRALSRLGYAYAVTARRGEAQKVLNQLNALSEHKYVPAIDIADIYAGLGEKDKAFEWLEK